MNKVFSFGIILIFVMAVPRKEAKMKSEQGGNIVFFQVLYTVSVGHPLIRESELALQCSLVQL